MRSSRQGAIPSELGWLVDELDDIARRLHTLEAPSGESLSNTVARLQDATTALADLVANLEARMEDFIDNDVEAIVDAKVGTAIAALLAGNLSIGGNLDVAGVVTMPAVYDTDITVGGGLRRTAWIREDGRLGHT